MDYELKQKYAPKKRHTKFATLGEASTWARSLQWRTNEYDFFRLCQAVYDCLDSHYRAEYGLRMDQFVSREEILREARPHIEFYEQEKLAECIDFFRFLFYTLDSQFSGRFHVALDRRRVIVEAGADDKAA